MKTNLESILRSTGVFHSYAGYGFFLEAISMAAEDPDCLKEIQKNLYLPIAERHQADVRNVINNIKTIRNVIMRNGGYPLLEELADCKFRQKNQPYPKEIIEIFADYVRKNQNSVR